MWNIISILLLIVETVLLAGFVIGRFRKKRLNETFVFLGLVFVINLALYLVPYLHSVIVLGTEGNRVFEILECIMGAVQLFLGGVNTDAVAEFTLEVPSFTYTYLLGALLALLATVSAAVEAFSHTIGNSFRLAKALKQPVCDIVLGSSPMALHYAKENANTVLLLDDTVDKETAVALMEEGFVVLRKGFSPELLNSRYLGTKTRYNIICPNEKETYFEYLDAFLSFKKQDTRSKDIALFIEVSGEKAETIRREIIEKSGCSSCITTFCTQELLARTFLEEHPVTEHLPRAFIGEDTSVKPDAKINVFFLGFGDLSRELYRQSVLNNQLVKFENGEYRVFPLHYHIYDTAAQAQEWNIGGLDKALGELQENAGAYFPLPEMPCVSRVVRKAPHLRDTLSEITKAIREKQTYSCIIVDTGDNFQNIETGTRLRSMLSGAENFHIFIRSATPYTEDDEQIAYYGDFDRVFTHGIIVNDSLSAMAKKINEVYAGDSQKAEESWKALNYFTLYSNICSAMNLRLKLNLLGLDYVKDGKGENTGLIQKKYGRREGDYAYSEYFGRSIRNALLAQEHARWNAYHLLGEYLPLEKAGITVKSAEGQTVRFHTKNVPARKHACLTTFKGLDALSSRLADLAGEITGVPHKAEEYDFYIYDEMLITSAGELLSTLGYSVKEK